ncbi:hypothetical protein EG19_10335 [Thermoanaerobaculum aquaticum]|uniref:Permease n=1 Tax=Thermoanaerobaculum aquaticum TaxID=1312852 RepID=A0A062Y1A5_9BACT|nr:permease [Thermoanaerobaculum aquaticum]KDA54555.1 hypothetical protein EG19_10335 [Thermoanaerobaculum aquaticum]BCW94387.1 MAG: hypothetical protein KatS3mg007_2281 [Thermoanaerobaculum sp.]
MLEKLLVAGLAAVKEYVAAHVLTCLVPAFLLAGAMVTFIRRDTILRLLGEQVHKLKSFSLASVASFLVAACSCTVIPVASGLFYGGAGVGVAFIVLWVTPASNILALTYTGSILGGEMALARVAAALVMAFVVGGVMSWAFSGERRELPHQVHDPDTHSGMVDPRHLVLLAFLVLSLLLPNYLVQGGSYGRKVVVWALASGVMALYAWRVVARELIRQWLAETWWFVRIIFPLLLVGVFVVGVVGAVLPEEWVRRLVGGNGLLASFVATLFGAVSYFATMTEAPFVDTLMKMGMGKGPALALLLTGPGLSLPNWLAIARVFGVKKTLVYVPTVVVLGTVVGWVFGNFVF